MKNVSVHGSAQNWKLQIGHQMVCQASYSYQLSRYVMFEVSRFTCLNFVDVCTLENDMSQMTGDSNNHDSRFNTVVFLFWFSYFLP